MIRRSLLLLAAATGTVIACAPQALADSVDVPFSGTIDEICSFGTPSAGSLARMSGSSETIAADSTNGDLATVDVTCSAPVTITVEMPDQDGADATQLGLDYAMGSVGLSSDTLSNTVSIGGSAEPQTLNVGMFFTAISSIPADDYNFTVTLTAMPN